MEQVEFCAATLREGLRLSRRGLNERRPLRIRFLSGETGQVEVRLGTNSTTVVASVASKVVVPPPEKPNQGAIHFSVTYSQTCPPRSTNRATAQYIAYLLERLVHGSKIIDLKSLCILSKKQAWDLKVNVRILVDDGNVLDACGVATLAALMSHRRQDVSVTGHVVTVHSIEERAATQLPLLHHPVFVTVGVVKFDDETDAILLADPDHTEETLAGNALTIAANVAGDICLIQELGGGGLVSQRIINQCIELARGHVRDISEQVTKQLDQLRRDRERDFVKSIHQQAGEQAVEQAVND